MVYVLRPEPGLSGPNGLGGVRPDRHRNRLEAGFSLTSPDAALGVRIGKEGPPKQNDGQDDESDGCHIVHDSHKARGVPKLKLNNYS